MNWTKTTVPRSKTVEMEMVWSPLEEVACKEILQLLDNRNFRKDVMVIMKTRITNPVKVRVKINFYVIVALKNRKNIYTYLPRHMNMICSYKKVVEYAPKRGCFNSMLSCKS